MLFIAGVKVNVESHFLVDPLWCLASFPVHCISTRLHSSAVSLFCNVCIATWPKISLSFFPTRSASTREFLRAPLDVLHENSREISGNAYVYVHHVTMEVIGN